jgi:hypothetical protein
MINESSSKNAFKELEILTNGPADTTVIRDRM